MNSQDFVFIMIFIQVYIDSRISFIFLIGWVTSVIYLTISSIQSRGTLCLDVFVFVISINIARRQFLLDLKPMAYSYIKCYQSITLNNLFLIKVVIFVLPPVFIILYPGKFYCMGDDYLSCIYTAQSRVMTLFCCLYIHKGFIIAV